MRLNFPMSRNVSVAYLMPSFCSTLKYLRENESIRYYTWNEYELFTFFL